MAIIVFVLARTGAPELRQRMIQSAWVWPLQTTTAIAAAVGYVALWVRRFLVARYAVIVQSTLIVWGWALAQFPNIIMPDLSIQDTAAPPTTLRLLVLALAAGAVILLPSFVYLLRIFKKDATSRGR